MDRTGRHEKELCDPLARELGMGWRFIERKAALHACLLAALECSSAGHSSPLPHGCAVAHTTRRSAKQPINRDLHLALFRPLQSAREPRYEARAVLRRRGYR